MHKTVKLAIILMILGIPLTNCQSEKMDTHPGDIPVNDLNNSLELIAPLSWNTFKIGALVDLLIVNQSGRRIIFNQYFGKRIFLIQNDQFLEVENKMIVLNGQDHILEPGESTGSTFKVEIEKRKAVVRVYVIGKFEDSDAPVSAYLDVTVTP